MIEITGGRIYLEVGGVVQDGYYNQVYTAQAAAINLAMVTGEEVKILMPDQVVSYTASEPTPNPIMYVVLDNEEAEYTGTWQDSGVPGFIGSNAVYTSDGAATFNLAANPSGIYEIAAHITASDLRTTGARYEIGELVTVIDQQNQGGWQTLGQATLPNALIIERAIDDGSLVVDAIRYRLVEELTPVETKTARIWWEQAVADGELITPDRYELRIIDVDDNEVEILQIPGNLLETEVELELGEYTVEVRAVNRAGESPWSHKLTRVVE